MYKDRTLVREFWRPRLSLNTHEERIINAVEPLLQKSRSEIIRELAIEKAKETLAENGIELEGTHNSS